MTHLIALAAVLLTPFVEPLADSVDVIELNHVYGSDGEYILSQIIFWEWKPETNSEMVVAWRLWKPGTRSPADTAPARTMNCA